LQDVKTLLNKFITLRNFLADSFVQKENEVSAVLAGLLSGEPCFLIGSPGTAKTMLVEKMSKAIDCSYFYYLLTRYTEPDELLGSLDINALREGQYRRITKNRLPEAEIVFLDEIFKGSSATRNVLLDIILNKRYMNGTEYKRIPMLAFYSASNEISTDAEDQAFYDRLTIRCFTHNVSSDSWEQLLTQGIILENDNTAVIMSKEDVQQLQKMVQQRFQSYRAKDYNTLIKKYIEALSELKNLGIEISDRRKIKVLKVTAAISIIYLEQKTSLDSLADALRFTAVHDEDDLSKVEQVIVKCKLSTFYVHAQQLQTLSSELRNFMAQAERGGIEELKALTTVYKKTLQTIAGIPKNPRFLPYVRELKSVITEAKRLIEMKKKEIFGEDLNGEQSS